MVRAASIIHALAVAGLRSVKFTPWSEEADAEIDLGQGVTVQLGRGYVIVNRWIEAEQAMEHSLDRKTAELSLIVADAKRMLADARAGH